MQLKVALRRRHCRPPPKRAFGGGSFQNDGPFIRRKFTLRVTDTGSPTAPARRSVRQAGHRLEWSSDRRRQGLQKLHRWEEEEEKERKKKEKTEG